MDKLISVWTSEFQKSEFQKNFVKDNAKQESFPLCSLLLIAGYCCDFRFVFFLLFYFYSNKARHECDISDIALRK